MPRNIRKTSAIAVAVAMLRAGLTVASPPVAYAATCKGRDFQTYSVDRDTTFQTVGVSSCKAKQLIDACDTAKDAIGLGTLLGAKWWPVGVTGGVLFAFAWYNQSAIRSCAGKGSGIVFSQINGIVTSCKAQ